MHTFTVTKTDLNLLRFYADVQPLRRKLERARILPSDRVPGDVVTMGSRVRFTDGGVRRYAKLVYPQQADGRGRVSVLSPLGTTLLGLSSGQEVLARFPGSARRRIHVEEVLSQPERSRRKRSLDEKLDEALKQTFPASDAFSFALGF